MADTRRETPMNRFVAKAWPATVVTLVLGAAVFGLAVAKFDRTGIAIIDRNPSTIDVRGGSALAIGGAREFENYTSLKGLKAAADATVVGRFVRFQVGRVVQGDAAEDQLVYGLGIFVVDQSIRGPRRVTEELPVEFVLPVVSASEAREREQEFAAEIVGMRAVLFLRAKSGKGASLDPQLSAQEEGLYRAVSSRGLWAEGPDRMLRVPLAAEEVSRQFASELAGVSSFDAFTKRVAEL
jgi:hypothetical protein